MVENKVPKFEQNKVSKNIPKLNTISNYTLENPCICNFSKLFKDV